MSAREPRSFLEWLRAEAKLQRRDDPLLGDFARDVMAIERGLGPPSKRPKRRPLPPEPHTTQTKDEILAFYRTQPTEAQIDAFFAEFSQALDEYRRRKREWVAAGFPPNPRTFEEVAEYLERAGFASGFPDVHNVAHHAWLQYQVNQ